MARLSTRDKAFALAISIIEERAVEIRDVYDDWAKRYPSDKIGAAVERAAYMECQLLARLIGEKMSPAGRAEQAEAGKK